MRLACSHQVGFCVVLLFVGMGRCCSNVLLGHVVVRVCEHCRCCAFHGEVARHFHNASTNHKRTLLSGDSEEKARNCHHSHEHWLGVLQHSVSQLAEAVALFADILPRKLRRRWFLRGANR